MEAIFDFTKEFNAAHFINLPCNSVDTAFKHSSKNFCGCVA